MGWARWRPVRRDSCGDSRRRHQQQAAPDGDHLRDADHDHADGSAISGRVPEAVTNLQRGSLFRQAHPKVAPDPADGDGEPRRSAGIGSQLHHCLIAVAQAPGGPAFRRSLLLAISRPAHTRAAEECHGSSRSHWRIQQLNRLGIYFYHFKSDIHFFHCWKIILLPRHLYWLKLSCALTFCFKVLNVTHCTRLEQWYEQLHWADVSFLQTSSECDKFLLSDSQLTRHIYNFGSEQCANSSFVSFVHFGEIEEELYQCLNSVWGWASALPFTPKYIYLFIYITPSTRKGQIFTDYLNSKYLFNVFIHGKKILNQAIN